MYNNKHIRYKVIIGDRVVYCYNLTQVSAYCNCSVNKLNKSFIGCIAIINGVKVIRETNNWILANSGQYKYSGLSFTVYCIIIIFSVLLSLGTYSVLCNNYNIDYVTEQIY